MMLLHRRKMVTRTMKGTVVVEMAKEAEVSQYFLGVVVSVAAAGAAGGAGAVALRGTVVTGDDPVPHQRQRHRLRRLRLLLRHEASSLVSVKDVANASFVRNPTHHRRPRLRHQNEVTSPPPLPSLAVLPSRPRYHPHSDDEDDLGCCCCFCWRCRCSCCYY